MPKANHCISRNRILKHVGIPIRIFHMPAFGQSYTFFYMWQMDISNLTYRDRATDKHVTMYGQLKVTPSRNGVLSPEGEKVPLLTMSEEKAKEILEQGKSQVQWYINQLFN